MLRCIAIDDEPPALELLEDYIGKIDYLQLVATSSNPVEAIEIIREKNADLVFLDIRMPRLSGLQLIQSLQIKPMFILVTAYEKHAVDAFFLNVVDYLVKPVPFDRFILAADRARQQFGLKALASGEQKADHVFIYADSTYIRLQFDTILYIEAQKDYVRIHLANNAKPVVARMSMKQMEEQLPAAVFIRIQKSYIVSKERISAIKKNSVSIGAIELPIGEMYRDSVFALIGRSTD